MSSRCRCFDDVTNSHNHVSDWLRLVQCFVSVSLQIQCLQQEKSKLEQDMEKVYKLQKDELEIQQLQHFQVENITPPFIIF